MHFSWSLTARYSDAQREAGVEPNSLTVAYDDSYLLERLIAVMRDLKKFPTKNELQMVKHRDPTLPTRTTFERLGRKQIVLSKLIAYCSDKPEYTDIIKLIGNVETPDTNPISAIEVQYGFVYLVRGHPGEYKIGRTNLVDRRLSELGATASIQQQLIHEIKTDDPAGIEAYWHRRFEAKRMRGEWFRLGPDDVKDFKRWKRIY